MVLIPVNVYREGKVETAFIKCQCRECFIENKSIKKGLRHRHPIHISFGPSVRMLQATDVFTIGRPIGVLLKCLTCNNYTDSCLGCNRCHGSYCSSSCANNDLMSKNHKCEQGKNK